ncbi:MAG: hypothetical protein Q9227_001874 [Pyrenula ochraceoflavens]
MGLSCFNCFSAKSQDEDLPNNVPRKNSTEKVVDEKAVAKSDEGSSKGKLSSEPTVEQVENTNHAHDKEGATELDASSTPKEIDSEKSLKPESNEQNPLVETKTDAEAKPTAVNPPTFERPSRGSSLSASRRSKDRSRSRSRSRSRTRSPHPLTFTTQDDVPPVPRSPRSPLSPVSLTVPRSSKDGEIRPKSPSSVHKSPLDEAAPAEIPLSGNEASTSEDLLKEDAQQATTQSPRPDSGVLPLLQGEVNESVKHEEIGEVKNDVKDEARDAPSEKLDEEETTQEKEAAPEQTQSPTTAASSTSPISPAQSPSSPVPSPPENESQSNSKQPAMETKESSSHISPPSLPASPPSDTTKPSPLKLTKEDTPTTPPLTSLLIPEKKQSTPRPISSSDAAAADTTKSPTSIITTPTTAADTSPATPSSSRPEIARTQTAPSKAAVDSPTTKAEKRKTRLSRFLTVGAKSKRPPPPAEKLPSAKEEPKKTSSDTSTHLSSPKRLTFSRGSDKGRRTSLVKDGGAQVHEVGVVDDIVTPDTALSVQGRAWKKDDDNDSLFCY